MTVLQTIPVTGPAPYQVVVGDNLLGDIADSVSGGLVSAQVVPIIYQEAVAKAVGALAQLLEGRGVTAVPIAVPDAEEGKTLAVAENLWDRFGELGVSRKDAVIAVGGGAATDLAGFVAATWMRGIPVIQVPTTVLAMVDAAVGGKTGINTAAGKNLVGSFHEPTAVFVDVDFLQTLPRAEIVAGSAEIIKTGFIADERILNLFVKDPQRCLDPAGDLPELLCRSIAVKARVVSEDLKEAGLREILNYGHTFGHAVEKHENFSWRHGHAVSVGMVYVAELAARSGLMKPELVDVHRKILADVGLPTHYDQAPFEVLLKAMGRDKKSHHGMLRFVVLEDIGKTARLENPSLEVLQEAYDAVASTDLDARAASKR